MKYLVEFRDHLLTEGGNAFENTVSIPRDKVESIFTKFKATVASAFDGQFEPELIGSWRQKALSGDLDALLHSEFSLEEISSRLQEAGYETKIFYGFNIVSVRFEFEPGKAAQIDLFVRPKSDNEQMATLFYKSPLDEKYSTKHRVFLIFSALDSMKFDTVGDGSGGLAKFKGYMLRPDGLYEFTKEKKKVNFSIVDRRKVTDNIDQISKILFGQVVPYSEWNTYEKTLSCLKNNSGLNIGQILKNYREKLSDEGLAIPQSAS
jgi:hypothetical protein